MKKFYLPLILICILLNEAPKAQITCDMMALSVSSSDTSYVQLYHAGAYLLWPRDPNVIEFTLSDSQGNIFHQDTIYGSNGFMLFNHTIPVTDTMNVQSIIRNDSLGIVCLIEDKLYWKVTQVLPGSSFGNWEILDSNTGTNITSVKNTIQTEQIFSIFPSPVSDLLQINGPNEHYGLNVFDLHGKLISSKTALRGPSSIDVSQFINGIYFLHCYNNKTTSTLRFVKR